jgi:hypothetical protein
MRAEYGIAMTDLTDDERDALAHWSAFGRPGAVAVDRYVPTPEDLARVKPFLSSASADWSYDLDRAQTAAVLRGFRAEEMEDKWNIWSDDVSESGATSIYFCRSWTGKLIVRVDIRVSDAGARVVHATWETDSTAIKDPSETFARRQFEECCAWVLGAARPVPNTTLRGEP